MDTSRARELLLAAALLLASAAAAHADEPYDAVVVGGGPGGYATAIKLSQELRAAGRTPRILLVEKRSATGAFTREQVLAMNPELFTALRALGVALPDRSGVASRSRIRTDVRRILAGVVRGTPPYQPWVSDTHTIAINDLQRRMRDTAEAAGVEVAFDTEFAAVGALDAPRAGDAVDVELKGPAGARRVKARWLVGADGASSRVRAAAGIELRPAAHKVPMAGIWFDGAPRRDLIIRRGEFARESPLSVYLSTHDTAYMLTVVPWSARTILERAERAGRPLSDSERARVEGLVADHAAEQLQFMLPRGQARQVRVRPRVMIFDAAPTHVERFYAAETKTALVGDAAQKVNPLSASGARTAITQGLVLGKSLAQATLRGDDAPVRDGYTRAAHVLAARAVGFEATGLRKVVETPCRVHQLCEVLGNGLRRLVPPRGRAPRGP